MKGQDESIGKYRFSEDITEGDQRVQISNIYILGNKKTKDRIILREMSLKKGTSAFLNEIEKSIESDKINIVNTNLFNSVSIEILKETDNTINLFIKVNERWYFWPAPLIEIADRNLMDWLVNRDGDANRFNYGLRLNHLNVGGQNRILKINGKIGFETNLYFNYSIPFIDNSQKNGLGFTYSYSELYNVAFVTKDHISQFFNANEKNKNATLVAIEYTYRPSFYNFHRVKLNYQNSEVSDTIISLNPNYHFNGEKQQQYFGLSYSFTSDHRNNKRFATKGHIFMLDIEKIGLGNQNNFNRFSVGLKFNNYYTFSKDFFLANGILGLHTSPSNQPYYNYEGIGYEEILVRGFELDLIEGSSFLLQKNSIRKKIFDHSKDIGNLMPLSQFVQFRMAAYFKFFADFAWVDNYPNYEISNRLTNQLLYSFGVGLDLVAMYDMVLRLEYSHNSENERNFALNIKADL